LAIGNRQCIVVAVEHSSGQLAGSVEEAARAFRLPSPADLAAMQALVRDGDAAERIRVAGDAGLLKDLAECFSQPTTDGAGPRRVDDLAEVVEALSASVEAMGVTDAKTIELRLRDAHIHRSDLPSVDMSWPVRLEHCVFHAPATFVGAQFAGAARFVGCTFHHEANFFAATFEAEAYFGGCTFVGQADFRGASFCGAVDFFQANYRDSIELRYATFANAATLNVYELRFRGSTALGGSFHLHLGQLRTGHWLGYRGRIAAEHNRDNRREMEAACEQYGELEANFAAQGSPDASATRDWCHYRYLDLHRQTQHGPWHPLRVLDWFFMKWCFGYGIFTKRILISGLFAIFFFALLYLTNGLGLPETAWSVHDVNERSIMTAGDVWERIGNAIYFSAVSFSTIGYGDLHPVHAAKFAGAFEGLLGVFIMSVFTVSFSRKILR
jgi:hypothetical protein